MPSSSPSAAFSPPRPLRIRVVAEVSREGQTFLRDDLRRVRTADLPEAQNDIAWNLQTTREILESAASGRAPPGSTERKIGDYYPSY
jgi:hypothetical protein